MVAKVFIQHMVKNKIEMMVFGKKNPAARYIFEFMELSMDDNNSLIVSIGAMSSILSMNVRSIHRSITALKENKLISVTRTGGSSVYHLNSRVVKIRNKTKDSYTLSANVVLSTEESRNLCDMIRAQVKKHKIGDL